MTFVEAVHQSLCILYIRSDTVGTVLFPHCSIYTEYSLLLPSKLAFPSRNNGVEQKWGGFPLRAGTFFLRRTVKGRDGVKGESN